MAVSLFTSLKYPLSDTLNSKVNPKILEQELTASELSITLSGVELSGTTIRIDIIGIISQEDVDTIDAVVAAHEGADFNSETQFMREESELSDDTGGIIDRLILETGALSAGDYRLDWYMEVASTDPGELSGVRGALRAALNGNALQILGEIETNENGWSPMSGSLPLTVVDGDSAEIRLSFIRTGDAGDPARTQRARVFLIKL